MKPNTVYCSWQILVVLVLSIKVSGCVPEKEVECELPSNSSQLHEIERLDIDLYVDGTPSMAGFVTNTTDNWYLKTLDAIGSVIETGAIQTNSVPNYYRLGTFKNPENDSVKSVKFQPIKRKEYLQAKLPEFYNGTSHNFPFLEVSQIDAAIDNKIKQKENANTDQLSIIITDLYQKNADITQISKAIRQNYFDGTSSNSTIAIIGIKSNFEGYIYDVGITADRYYWSGQHPFYIIIIGSYEVAIDTINQIKKELDNFQQHAKIVVFSPQNIISQPIGFRNLPADDNLPEGINRTLSINNGEVRVRNTKNFDFLNIEPQFDKDTQIVYTQSLETNPYSLQFDSVKTQISVEKYDEFDREFKEDERSSTQQALQLKDWTIEDENIKSTTVLQSDRLDEGVYLFTIEAIAQSLEEPDWWREWSSPQDSRDGTKTHNLRRFLRQIQSIVISSEPKIGKFCYVINRE